MRQAGPPSDHQEEPSVKKIKPVKAWGLRKSTNGMVMPRAYTTRDEAVAFAYDWDSLKLRYALIRVEIRPVPPARRRAASRRGK